MGVTRVKDGVTFSRIAPAGFRILSAIDQVAFALGTDLVITSACDGAHSGPNDPHHRGEAYDVRTHDMSEELKQKVLSEIQRRLDSEHFYVFLEAAGTPNEHIHGQVKKGVPYYDKITL